MHRAGRGVISIKAGGQLGVRNLILRVARSWIAFNVCLMLRNFLAPRYPYKFKYIKTCRYFAIAVP